MYNFSLSFVELHFIFSPIILLPGVSASGSPEALRHDAERVLGLVYLHLGLSALENITKIGQSLEPLQKALDVG